MMLDAYHVQSGADIIFRSFLAPTMGRYFSGSHSTAAGVRSRVDGFGKAE